MGWSWAGTAGGAVDSSGRLVQVTGYLKHDQSPRVQRRLLRQEDRVDRDPGRDWEFVGVFEFEYEGYGVYVGPEQEAWTTIALQLTDDPTV